MADVFLWTKQGALNYDRSKERWPRTQTLDPVFEINSGAFLTNIQTYKEEKDVYESKKEDSVLLDYEGTIDGKNFDAKNVKS